jgi:hypothetical protein
MSSPRVQNTQSGYLPGIKSPLNNFPSSGLNRKGWQELVKSQTGPGVSAAQAAHNIDPFYMAENEGSPRNYPNNGRYSSPGRSRMQSSNGRYGSPGRSRMQSTNGRYGSPGRSRMQSTNGRYGSPGTPLVPAYNPNRVDMSMKELGAQRTQQGQYYGLGRPGYQTAISETSRPGVGPTGLTGAARAASELDPSYLSQTERSGLTAKQWQDAIRQTTQQYGVSAADAAQILDPQYNAPGEDTRYQTYNPSVSIVNGYSNQYGNQTVPVSGLHTNYGMYGGLTGYYPGGTPREPADPDLTKSQANVLMGLQATDPSVYPRKAPASKGYLNEEDVRRIAQALGISTEGNRTALVAEIKNRVSAMSPRTQQQFVGGLSPRSQQFFTPQSPGRQSPGLQTL